MAIWRSYLKAGFQNALKSVQFIEEKLSRLLFCCRGSNNAKNGLGSEADTF